MNRSDQRGTLRPALSAGAYAWLAVGVLALTVYGSLLPFQFQPKPLADAWESFREIQVFAVSDLAARGDWVISWILFALLSFLLMAALCVDRPRLMDLGAVILVVPCGIALALTLEFAQVYFPPRTVSLNDVAVESLGIGAGAVVWMVLGRQVTGWARRVATETNAQGLAGRLLPGYLTVLVAFEFMPFDLIVRPEELALKYQEGKICLIPFQALLTGKSPLSARILGNPTCYALLGFLLSLGKRFGSERARLLVLALTVPALVESVKLLVYSRSCDTTNVLVGAGSMLVGYRLAEVAAAHLAARAVRFRVPTRRTSGEESWQAFFFAGLLLSWAGLIFLLNWWPFDFTTDPTALAGNPEGGSVSETRTLNLVPLVDYYWGSKYQAIDQFVYKAASFLPLGMMAAFARRGIDPRGPGMRAMLATLVLTGLIETGRFFLPTKTASSTNMLIEVFGAWLGFRVALRIRAVSWEERSDRSWGSISGTLGGRPA